MGVDISASLYAEYKRMRKIADDAERQGSYRQAAYAYRQAAQIMRQYATASRETSIRRQRLQKAITLEQTADKLEALPDKIVAASLSRVGETTGNEDDYEGMVQGFIQKTTVRWEDIGGLEETKAQIKSAYGLALARKPSGVEISPLRNLMFYGPPGTGKTLLAAATAGSVEATFFNVTVSNLLSKYFGESTKIISALFNVARKQAPAVIFLDEFESLTPPRGSGESGAERRIVSQFLAELDGLASRQSEAFILTMVATNLPWLVDSAILSRFQQKIYLPLPDKEARKAILEIQLNRRGHRSHYPLEVLVNKTEGFSGREIAQLCQAAITHMIQRKNPDLLRVVDQGQRAISAYILKIEALDESDFSEAFRQIKPVTTPAMLEQYKAWANQVALSG